MAFLTSLGSKGSDSSKAPVGERILNTNPVLEAFGNSRTARNNNSSRFGKYTKMYFDVSDGMVMGAEIKNYLLEKSRVTGSTDKERNYHIYFFMIRGCDEDVAKRLDFLKPDKSRKSFPDFKYLSKCNDLPVEKDVKEYKELMDAFSTLGFTKGEVDAIHSITAASLHIGELELDVKTYNEGKTPVSIKNKDKLKQIASFLGIQSPEDLEVEIVNKEAMQGFGRTPAKPDAVGDAVKSLAKALYNNMFDWLVAKMNVEILPDDIKSREPAAVQEFGLKTRTIGLLDIFGFENFELNQFEQLCINFVNEKLHNLYICSVFGSEKKEMEREQLEITLKLPDMKVTRVLLLMNSKKAPLGLFQNVDDKSGGGLGTDDKDKRVQELYNVITKTHDPTK